MLYYAILILGSNELGPVNNIEYAYLVAVLIVSSLMNALLLSDIVVLIGSLDKEDNKN